MNMFRAAPPELVPVDETGDRVSADLVPLSHLALDLGGVPETGWADFLGRRAMKFVPDDLGRDSVSRHDAKLLLDERRLNEIRKAKFRAQQEAEAIEADQRWRQSLPHGIPAGAVPDGSSPSDLMAAAAYAAAAAEHPRRRSLTEEVFDNGGGMTFHSYQPQPSGGE